MAQQIPEITSIPSNSNVLKILNQIIKRYNSLGSIYTFKGSVQTYDDLLAIQNPQIGDVYNVIQEDEEHQIAAGSNFVWDGTIWDNLGGSLAGLVQSVNGINPDSLGNVLLPLIKNVTAAGGNIVFTKNDDTTIQVDNIKKLYTVWLKQTADLNNLVEAGIYMCGNDSYAANYENCPIQKAFLLEVQAASSDFVYQFLTQYNDGSTEAGNQYIRTYFNNNWSAWRMAGSGSNLTTYTSLEQLNITPGQETFASIHNALPINSVLEYYAYPNSNFNDEFYPVTSYYGVLQAVKLNGTKTVFSFYAHSVVSGNEFSTLYLSAFDINFTDSRTAVWKKVALDSDLTNLSNSVVKTLDNVAPVNNNIKMWNWFHRYPYTDFTNGLTTLEWINKGLFSCYFSASQTFPQKPSDWGQLINIPATEPYTGGSDAFQLFIAQASGDIYYRGTNASEQLDEVPFKRLTYVGESWAISKGTNGWARESSTGFTIQWGTYTLSQTEDNATFTFNLPRTFTTNYGIQVFDYNNLQISEWLNALAITAYSTNNFTIRKGYSQATTIKIIAIGIS